jgi:UDP-N-acetylmuramyl pentapeptide synthase
MESLWQDLPETRRGAYAEAGATLEPILLQEIGPGDVVMIKASAGTRLGPLVEAVKRRFAPDAENQR